jgi:hypothetical protein
MEYQNLSHTGMKYVNIIHDSRRSEKYPLLIAELSRQGLTEEDYEIWPCMLVGSVIESINASHKMIIQKAKDEAMEDICVMEDDVLFPSSDGFRYFLDSKPPFPWRVYLAGAYAVEWYKPLPRWVTHFVGMHCYLMNRIFYDVFLDIPSDKHIDTAVSDMIKQWDISVICCYPMAAIQRKGWSQNNMKEVDYNYVLKTEDVYGGLP